MNTLFHQKVVKIIKQIPPGKIATYGQIALYAGNPRASRQVARILHSSSDKEKLPWQRVINRKGYISLKKGAGFEKQKALLQSEGIRIDLQGKINLRRYLWEPGKI
jgi:methylated-DNA-protein-cysteine methyltransferase-like protein